QDTREEGALGYLARAVAAVAARMGPEQAAQAAASLLDATRGFPEWLQEDSARALGMLLVEVPPAARRRQAEVAAAAGGGAGPPRLRLPFFLAPAGPLPCRLSTQQLVDLLKQPTCFGAARRLLLDHLGRRYERRFADQWEFVRFATERDLDLDLTS